MFSGLTSLKPTAGRIPIAGQGSDGGLIGVVGLYNTLGFMARSAKGIEACLREIVSKNSVSTILNDARFVPLPWQEERTKSGAKLRIGW